MSQHLAPVAAQAVAALAEQHRRDLIAGAEAHRIARFDRSIHYPRTRSASTSSTRRLARLRLLRSAPVSTPCASSKRSRQETRNNDVEIFEIALGAYARRRR